MALRQFPRTRGRAGKDWQSSARRLDEREMRQVGKTDDRKINPNALKGAELTSLLPESWRRRGTADEGKPRLAENRLSAPADRDSRRGLG